MEATVIPMDSRDGFATVDDQSPMEVGRFSVRAANGTFSVRIREDATVYVRWMIAFLPNREEQFAVLDEKRLRVTLLTDAGLVSSSGHKSTPAGGRLHQCSGAEVFAFAGVKRTDVRRVRVNVDQTEMIFPVAR